MKISANPLLNLLSRPSLRRSPSLLLASAATKAPEKEASKDVKDLAMQSLLQLTGYTKNFAFMELVTGFIAAASTKFHSGWVAWTIDSAFEYVQNAILENPDIKFPKFLVNLTKMISRDYVDPAEGSAHKHDAHEHSHDHAHVHAAGKSDASHAHGKTCDKNHKEDELHIGCNHGVFSNDIKEQVIALTSLASSAVSMVYSLIKPSFFPYEGKSSEDGFFKTIFKTIVPAATSGIMIGSGLVKGRLGNIAGAKAFMNHRTEDYSCGFEALTLALAANIDKLSPQLAKWSEMILGTGISYASIANALKGLGYDFITPSAIMKTLGLYKDPDPSKKYKLSWIEKSAPADMFYSFYINMLKMMGYEMPDKLHERAENGGQIIY